MGNPNLKRRDTSIEWTADLVKEYMKCSKDAVYFVEKYVKVINLDSGLVPMKLYDYQREMLLSMSENRYTIITTARQAGKSTVTCAFLLWYILFNEDKTVALLANKGDTAREILGKVQLAYQHLPKWLQHGILEWNKGSFVLENNSRVIASATTGSAIRGYSINVLLIDEAAHIENWDDFFTSVYPTISSGKDTKIILVSTPFGLNHFHQIWVNAINKKNEYNPIMVTWDRVPGRDDNWKQQTLANMNFDEEKFAQEHSCSFHGSSGTLIAGWKLKELVDQIPVKKHDGLYQYKAPVKDRIYVLVADVSRGKGLDYSAFSVMDVSSMPYDQVCVFRSNEILVADYADVVYHTAKLYNNAYVLVEINDIGEQVPYTLIEHFEYDNVLYTENGGRNGKKLSAGFGAAGKDNGIRTTKTVKHTGCSMLKMLVEQNQLIINDKNTISELNTFSKKNNTYEAEAGKHDDIVMGLVLFGWMTNQPYFKEMTDTNAMMTLREKSSQEVTEDLIPFGFIDDGRDDEQLPRGWLSVENDGL